MSVILADVQAAADRIRGLVHETPVVTSETLDRLAGCEIFLKCENLQKAGAFKARGAMNAVLLLSDHIRARGVATHSSGNHGAALARAAQIKGVPAYIVVPANAKQVKQDAIRGYGGEVILCEPTLKAREEMLDKVIRETGATIVHPYDQDEIIAGQGTAALELIDQVPQLDALVVPVGGGGLLAGSCLVAEHHHIAIYGAEPSGADDAKRSLATGERVTSHVPDTLCDGLLTTLGERNFAIIQPRVVDIQLAHEEDVILAMRLIWTRTKLVVEPSSAICLAVVLNNPEVYAGKRVGLMLTGGNVDLTAMPF